MTSPQRLAFIGLGAMGYPMAGHLARAGHEVTVFNRTAARAEAWQNEYGGHVAPTPAAAAQDQDAVMLCVGNDDDVREVTTGERGALQSMRESALLIDHTTTSEALATSLAALADQSGVAFLDAPVSGGQIGAENGALTVMVGADENAFTGALPLIECYAKSVRRMGPVGAGQLTKMVNQICIAGLLQGLSEGIHFAERAGLDVTAAIEVITQGAAHSWQMSNRAETMIKGEFDFGFAVDWMRKDLGIAIAAAQSVGAEVPVTQLVDSFYADVQDLGGHRWDTSSLIQRLRAGKTMP
ncbi:MAG: NAD(P)-dependent oxidoreductase [Halieaceae bacterium]|mgnify:FL=1|nr:MAG: NAD(P)-dependent oxidoreductase [Halieaceae bacterium]